MKRTKRIIALMLLVAFCGMSLFAQAPAKIRYQAVARDAENAIMQETKKQAKKIQYFSFCFRAFCFLKVIQSLFRGSLDHSEFFKKSKWKIFDGYESTINYTDTLYDFVGPTGYILFALIYFCFSFVFIKGVLVSICFIDYKNIYLIRQKEEEIMRKEKQKQERSRLRAEQKAKIAKAKKKKEEKKQAEIEMQNLHNE